jgi:hypothetical protein
MLAVPRAAANFPDFLNHRTMALSSGREGARNWIFLEHSSHLGGRKGTQPFLPPAKIFQSQLREECKQEAALSRRARGTWPLRQAKHHISQASWGLPGRRAATLHCPPASHSEMVLGCTQYRAGQLSTVLTPLYRPQDVSTSPALCPSPVLSLSGDQQGLAPAASLARPS